jgi:putative acetyltransferase
VRILVEDPGTSDVVELLEQHLTDMYATSPPESVHALDLTRLRVPSVTFWTARSADDGTLLGCGALKEHVGDDGITGEIKSMRTAEPARGRGVAAAILKVIVEQARARGYDRVDLETGTQDFFAPARRLYVRHGFLPCGPFADYVEDPNSAFFTLVL